MPDKVRNQRRSNPFYATSHKQQKYQSVWKVLLFFFQMFDID